MPKSILSQQQVKALLHYSPDTGIFTWKKRHVSSRYDLRFNRHTAGNPIPTRPESNGYIRVRLNGRLYLTHRLAFLYMTGKWPKNEVDHINRIRGDNRWCNLRDVTKSANQRNRKGRGFHKLKGGGYRVRVGGTYKTKFAAAYAHYVLTQMI